MTYRELLETTKRNPGCLWTKDQRNKNFDEKFKNWLRQQEQEKSTKIKHQI